MEDPIDTLHDKDKEDGVFNESEKLIERVFTKHIEDNPKVHNHLV